MSRGSINALGAWSALPSEGPIHVYGKLRELFKPAWALTLSSGHRVLSLNRKIGGQRSISLDLSSSI